jgi:hypothetical protein
MTYTQRIEAYRDELATRAKLTPMDRTRYLASYSGNGSAPRHCWRCDRQDGDGHAPGCDAATASPVAILCDDCGRDVSEQPHYEACPKRAPKCAMCGADAELEEFHAVTCEFHPDFFEPRDEHDSPCDEPEWDDA